MPRVINTDGHSAYPPAIVRLKAEGALDEDCRHRPVPYLNNVLEQDHRAIKRRMINASQHFRSFCPSSTVNGAFFKTIKYWSGFADDCRSKMLKCSANM